MAQERLPYPARLKHGGVSRRVKKVVEHLGLQNNMIPGKKRYGVQLDHGFRKYFNTMLRRAKVDFADKEDMRENVITTIRAPLPNAMIASRVFPPKLANFVSIAPTINGNPVRKPYNNAFSRDNVVFYTDLTILDYLETKPM